VILYIDCIGGVAGELLYKSLIDAGATVAALLVNAAAILLVSPVSWSHHWVWAVPIALALSERSRVATGLWVAVFVARPILWPPWGQQREYDWTWYDRLDGNAYVLAALIPTAWLAARFGRLLREDRLPSDNKRPNLGATGPV